MIIGIKSLIGIGLAGVSIAGLGVGGHFLLSKKTTQTIRDKIEGKTPLAYYVKTEPENAEIKGAWTKKKNTYSGDANVNEDILRKEGIDEEKLSGKCKEILETPLNQEPTDLNKKVEWAKKWCFASE